MTAVKGAVGSPSGEAPGGEPRCPPFRSQELRAIVGALFCKVTLRSPGVCERIARNETRLLPEVSWGYHICMLDPDTELIVNQAKAAIHSCQGPTLF